MSLHAIGFLTNSDVKTAHLNIQMWSYQSFLIVSQVFVDTTEVKLFKKNIVSFVLNLKSNTNNIFWIKEKKVSHGF